MDASEFEEFSQRLRLAEREVKNALRKRIREAGKPLAEAVIQEAPDGMPSRGGLADWLRQARPGLSMTGTRMAIRLARGKHDLAALNRGRLRHPVFGNRGAWGTQAVPAGLWDREFERQAERGALDEVQRVVDDVMEAL